MVAKIESGKNLMGALQYNEKKVSAGKAEFLEARGYWAHAGNLTLHDKIFRLQDLAGRNQRTRTNTVHISLNFDPSESLEKDMMVAIADRYMAGIGFKDQPYLVYQHFDAGHPHMHILSTNIRANGERISLHNLGKTISNDVRQQIEEAFGLVKAAGRSLSTSKLTALTPVTYGKQASKKAIADTVNFVVQHYRFTSLAELNAVLNQVNILVDRGDKASVMYRKHGLRYWITDEAGKKTGVPIKASMIPGRPTMKLLEKRFLLNAGLRKPLIAGVRSEVEDALNRSESLFGFQKALSRFGITVDLRYNDSGLLYGVTFVDHQRKLAVKGSDLGKSFSANAIKYRFAQDAGSKPSSRILEKYVIHSLAQSTADVGSDTSQGLLDALLATEKNQEGLPAGLVQNKRRKKRKRLNL